MNNLIRSLAAILLCTSWLPAHAQFGPQRGPAAPDLSGAAAKLFGGNTAFSANMEMQTQGGKSGEAMTIPGKMFFLDGKTRFEMDMTQAEGAAMPKGMGEQLKQMGMANTVMITRPDLKNTFMIYPGLHAYASMPIKAADDTAPESDFKVETTELGKEKLEGHDCVKNKVVVTDKNGKAHEFTVWNASDMKNFPVKIETSEQGTGVVMLFKNVNFDKPAADQFDPPADFKKYDTMMALMQQEMMKRMGGPGMR